MKKSWVWAEVMLYLWEKNNGASKTEIKKYLKKYSESAVITNIARLVRFKYIVSLRNVYDDGRKTSVFMTEKGKVLCKAIVALKSALGRNWKKL